MKELKTLKEIEHNEIITECFNKICCKDSRDEEIKQEAIKWIKFKWQQEIYTDLGFEERNAVRDWIKHFFNITEEDYSKLVL